MKQYYKIENGKKIFAGRRIIIGDMHVINPAHEQYIEAGWTEYTPEPVVPQPKLAPYQDEMVMAMRSFMQPQLMTLSDSEALEKKVLYDTWSSKIGINVSQGERLYYDDKLYKVRQEHLVQEQYPPSTDTLSLYEVIQEQSTGTKDDPIAYVRNMALEHGKFYTQYDILYECYNAMQAMPYDLKDLAAHVRVVE